MALSSLSRQMLLGPEPANVLGALVTHLLAAASIDIVSVWDRTRGRSSAQFNSFKTYLLNIR